MTHDDTAGGWGLLVGSGILLLEVCVLVPGLLAALLLTAALALPLLLPAVPVAILVGVFLAVRGLGRGVVHLIRSTPRREGDGR
jgi:cobalamin biosynthesis protein CobD/CbiB